MKELSPEEISLRLDDSLEDYKHEPPSKEERRKIVRKYRAFQNQLNGGDSLSISTAEIKGPINTYGRIRINLHLGDNDETEVVYSLKPVIPDEAETLEEDETLEGDTISKGDKLY